LGCQQPPAKKFTPQVFRAGRWRCGRRRCRSPLQACIDRRSVRVRIGTANESTLNKPYSETAEQRARCRAVAARSMAATVAASPTLRKRSLFFSHAARPTLRRKCDFAQNFSFPARQPPTLEPADNVFDNRMLMPEAGVRCARRA
jgi:hypothetical protein